jgi:hypothetical protein
METPLAEARSSEFCFPHLDTLVRVEVSDESVTIRATRDTFSPQRKDFFIRELVAEGFIPEHYRWSSPDEGDTPFSRIRWLVDWSWLTLNEKALQRSRRAVFRMLAGAVLLLGLLFDMGVAGMLGDSRESMRAARLSSLEVQKRFPIYPGRGKPAKIAFNSHDHRGAATDGATQRLPD